MASGAVAALLSPSLPHRTFTNGTFCAKFSSNPLFLPPSHKSSRQISISASAAATRGKKSEGEKKDAKDPVPMISTIDEFEATLKEAKNRLVVVEYAASHSVNSKKIYPAMVELSRSCPDVVFRLILGDESDDTKELCRRANITKVPYFIFYKNEEVVHEEEGMDEDMLLGDVLYYGETGNLIRQLHGKADVEELMNQSANGDGRLLVLDVGLKHCGPCVKVYPTVVKLARKMQDTAIFARLDGDESEDCMEYLRNMNVVEVPTFVFIKNGEICGRYVGSSRGELIGEILRYQGVKIT